MARKKRNVVAAPPTTRRSRSGASRSRSPKAAPATGSSRRKTASPAKASTPRATTSHMVSRQSARPMYVPSGTPSAVATVMPPITVASARPRRSGGTRDVAAALAAGV